MRKGFYFSFDALLALTLMSASLFVVMQSSDTATDPYKANSIEYRESNRIGRDAMKLASQQSFRSYDAAFKQDLKDSTVMNKEDLNRTILDGVTLLWAAGNFTHAREAVKKYFGSKVPTDYGYRIQVNESDTGHVLYETGSVPDDAETVSSISRLVSGHKINKPSEGFRARARATSITKNVTKIVPIPSMGNAWKNGKMEVWKQFDITDPVEIYNGTFYINVEYNSGQSVEQFKINGVNKKSDIVPIHDNGDTMYSKVDITDELKAGNNKMYIRIKGEASQSEPNEFQPGTMLRVKYRRDDFSPEITKTRHKRIYFENISAANPGSAESGIFKVESFELPKDSDFINASLHLHAKNLDSGNCGYDLWWTWGTDYPWDVMVNFNGDTIEETCASGDFEKEYSLDSSDVDYGTNVFAVFLESYGEDFWGDDEVGLYSDFETDTSSHIDLWYNVSENDLRFGEIKVTTAEEMGGGTDVEKVYDKVFSYKDLTRTQVYIAQRYSNTVHLEVDDGGGYREVFVSPGVKASPTRVTVPAKYYDVDNTNRVKLWDEYNKKWDPDIVRFYPESRFSWTVWAPSQVGYGKLFPTESEALNDAKKRLEDVLGPFVDATGISTNQVSTGNQPYIWGPASVKLVVWNNESRG